MVEIVTMIDNAEVVIAQFKQRTEIVIPLIRKEFIWAAEEILRVANELAPSGATHQLKGGYNYEVIEGKGYVRVNIGSPVRMQGLYAEIGSRPQPPPPIAAIQRWVEIKLGAGAMEASSKRARRKKVRALDLAYEIQRSIARKGTSSMARAVVGRQSEPFGTYGYLPLRRAFEQIIPKLDERLLKLSETMGRG